MLEKVKEYLQDKKVYFVTVGAGHLIGEEGVVENLRKKGYNTERIFCERMVKNED